jgi:hypothetical protein
VQVEYVESIADELEIVAASCLETLAEPAKQSALKNLTGYMIDTEIGTITSESLGSASMSYAAKRGSMRANRYGQMAVLFAPCLESIFATKKSGVMLIR